jgi:DnaK suppressor protein
MTPKRATPHQTKPSKVMSQNVEKTRYSDEELEEFKTLLEDKLARAKEQLDFYLKQLSEMADNPDSKVKGLDDGIGTAENERLTTMAARQKKHIQHLENALIRIQNKVYGVCRVTGKLISKERLRAVPHATLSIEAKQNRKK